ncbi:hypothetical protein AB3N61_09370 [Leptospira sp. WS58.C1]|uniref:hypothetical protein n=1 Tax=Leptospira cinconiae TaxID=3235173 RepID=UPI00349EA328
MSRKKKEIIATAKHIRIFEYVLFERDRQEELLKKGKFQYNAATKGIRAKAKLPILVEEVGEVAKVINEMSDQGIANDPAELKKELIQIAAVCFAWIESIEEDPT